MTYEDAIQSALEEVYAELDEQLQVESREK